MSETHLERIAAQYGVDLRRLRRILLPAETRQRLEALEALAEATRVAYLTAQERLAESQMAHGRLVRVVAERRQDLRGRDREEEAAAEQLVALVAAEVTRATAALESAAARAADAGRLAESVREHLLGRTAPHAVERMSA